MPSCDVLVIGGGHNGLVCAALLAKRGRKVVLLEAAGEIGGAARTVEFAPGFRVSHVAHVLNHLHPEVIQALELKRHGLTLAAANLPTTALAADGRHLTLHGAFGERLSGDIAPDEAAAWAALRGKLLRFAGTLRPFLTRTPPRLRGGGRGDALTLGKLGWAIRRLGRDEMREFLRMVLMDVADVLEEELSDPRLMGAVAFDAVLGTHLGPRSPTSLMSLFHRLAGEADGVPAALALPKGGMGAVAAAIAAAARAAGVDIRVNAAVARILVEGDRAVGVALADGSEILASIVVSGANPRTTFLDLLGPRALDTGFVRRVSHIRMRGNAAKLHLALDGLPELSGLDPALLAGRLVVAPGVDAVEAAFNPAKYGEASPEPVLEIVIPSLTDPDCAPPGRHVMSIVAQYAPAELRAGWDTGGPAFRDRILAVLERHWPGLSARVLAAELLTPADLEALYRMPGGHWHHGELAIDQLLMLRPVHGAGQYATPVPGLFLCGAGSHPGGGIMGAAGLNAARRILAGGS
ncbi:phytoene dehydrogenase-like protein [Inquilinus ginsengisoli]|uniref:Pyridine nucleotide-disulfide oxidoreductase domain-containing protein 2 n=1 Tax=Inquilinus ginsengisoli TaxID=363840 RepID=A0ABU1JPC2_9PROT|nr:NAD(P)/FAD-dependent oxidoreductase [Inquilinus ginsengisoli]MDR6289395.1 phytoene dehydrogenase-like protein [Inquilinus ginsengisoli]